jgi:preprotein translocase subunit SecE
MAMNMNRAQKRALRKMGAINENDAPVRTERAPRAKGERVSFGQFIREVRAELRKVAWPTLAEVKNYSIIVLITVVLFMAVVTLLDIGFSKGILWLYQ